MNLPREYLVEVGKGTQYTITPDLLRFVANEDWGDSGEHEEFVRELLRKTSDVIDRLHETIESTRRVNKMLYSGRSSV